MNSSINFSGFTDLLAQHAQEMREQAKQQQAAQALQRESQTPVKDLAKPVICHN